MYLGDDSFFLAEFLQSYLKGRKNLKILDMGSGSGIQAETCKNLGFDDVLAVDIDKEAVEFIKKKGILAIQSDLFSKINKKDKFDIIIFNAPYLPEDKHDKEKDTGGGKRGDETIIKFLNQAISHLNKDGTIILLLSSLTPRERINQLIKENYKKKTLDKKTIFFETLEIWEIKKK